MISKSKSLVFPIILVLYEIATCLSNDMYLPALPSMMQDLSLNTQQAQWTLTAWFIGSALLPLVMGVVCDYYGRRPTLLIGGLIYIASTMACALAANAQGLLIARFIEGAALPSMMVAGYACIHELYETREAIRILAFMGSITVLAPALGPLFGSIVLYLSSWRGIFWVIAIWSLINIAFLFYWMPETYPPEKRVPIHLKNLFMQYVRLFTNRQFMLLILVQGFIFSGFIVWISAGALLVIENFHYRPMVFGVIQASIFAAYIFGNALVKYLLEWLSVHGLIWAGLLVSLFGGAVLFAFAVLFPDAFYPLIAGMAIYSLGSGLCFAAFNRAVIEASDEPMSVRVALYTVLWTAFAVLGSVVASLYFAGTVRSIAYPVALAALIACVVMLFKKKS